MAKNTKLFLTAKLKLSAQTFIDTDTTSIKDLVVPSSDDAKLKSVEISTDETTANAIQFYWNDGTTNHKMNGIAIPPNSGTDAGATDKIEAIDKLANVIDGAGNKERDIEGGWKLTASMNTAVAAGKVVTVICNYEDFS